jgi:uncharacterized protein
VGGYSKNSSRENKSMKLRYRLIFLVLFLSTLIAIGYFTTKNFDFIVKDFWFASGLLLLVLMSLIDQPFFSTDANIFMNGTAGISLILVTSSARDFWWSVFLIWCIWLIVSSYFLMWINIYKPEFKRSERDLFSRINREIGKPEALFSAFFIWGAIRQFGINTSQIEPLFVFWAIFIVFNIPSIARTIEKYLDSLFNKQKNASDIGSLYRVADPRVVEIKLHKDCPNKIVGQIIGLSTTEGDKIAEAIVIDDRIMAGNRIAKIAVTAITPRWSYIAQQPTKMIFSIRDNRPIDPDIDIPISVVDVGSNIAYIKFFIHPDFPLRKGEIVWTSTGDGIRVYYQITLANIIEQNTIEGNTALSVLVTASQLGIWQESELRFEQFSWIPPAGHLIHHVTQKEIVDWEIPENKAKVGTVPNSTFPILVKIDDLVTHNTAVIGITGSGKSYLAFHLLEAFINKGIKVLILDLTREYFLYLQKFNPTPLKLASDVKNWYESESLIGIHQFANSTNYPETTKDFVAAAFDILSKTQLQPGVTMPARLCLVFEEAHSLIPEWNQVADKKDVNYVNATSRTILQGRKFGMGSLIVTQRTANVTKTILNQCNTMIAMRSFDQTGLDFLSNYMGAEYSQSISTLPSRDAIIVGKASSCQTPVIFTIPDFTSRWTSNSE